MSPEYIEKLIQKKKDISGSGKKEHTLANPIMLSRLPLARQAEREQLWQLVDQWNENRLDLFNLSYPTEVFESEFLEL